MNKMKKMYFVWGIIIVALFLILILFGFVYKNKSSDYKILEQKLVEAEKKYIDAKFLYPQDNKELKVTADILMKNGYLEELKVNNEDCDGYATIQKNGTVFEYKGYVACKNYKTKGYEK